MKSGSFSIMVLGVENICGFNVPVVFLEIGHIIHNRFHGYSLLENYGLTEKPCISMNKTSYIYSVTWAKASDKMSPNLQNMSVIEIVFFNFC